LRRHDLIVLRSLGANRAWVGRVVHAQASALALIALVIGAPFGIVAGRTAFKAFADRLGLVPDPAGSVVLVAVLVLVVLLVANLAAALPASRARHTSVASLLRTE
jgi:predicted lysophospholipase L1 biosynthesis ABC-type transport system permease subunit